MLKTKVQENCNPYTKMDALSVFGILLCLVLCYKMLDRLIRIPKVGNYDTKYIFITGCDTGFGYIIAKRLDQLGCHVIAACLTEKGETELRKQCSDRLITIHLDVADSASVKKAFVKVQELLPNESGLWGLINNAGIVGHDGPIQWLTQQNYQEILNVNLLGAITVATQFLPLLKRGGRGSIVNMSSIGGRIASPFHAPYAISKFGLEAFSDSIRRELHGFGISVHLIEPHAYRTPITSEQNYKSALLRSWKQVTNQKQDDYGKEWLDKALELWKELRVSDSPNLSDVTSAYEHALLDRFPRAQYVVGAKANYLLRPLICLPEWLSDFVFRRLIMIKPHAVIYNRYKP